MATKTPTKKVNVTKNGKCSVSINCFSCSTRYEMQGFSHEQSERLYNRGITGEKIQDIIPEVDKGWREMFVSGICPECWKKMFG